MRSAKYDNESISSLKGADRVRLRPSVIFGSDDLEGCKHSFFEILSNSIDEARAGYGDCIKVRRFKDGSIEVEDEGRGIPLDYNSSEERYNWELVYCELYAGGKYKNNAEGDLYGFSLGLNGLGACATQYASEYFDVEVKRDGFRYSLHFERGENVGGLQKEPYGGRKTGTRQRWRPDRDVFTETAIPLEYFQEVLKQQAIINSQVRFELSDEASGFQETYAYPEGIAAYCAELAGPKRLSEVQFFQVQGVGRDREDKEDYTVMAQIAFCFDQEQSSTQFFHNSSYLEYGGSPERAARTAIIAEFDRELKAQNKYKANEAKLSFKDVEDSLILIISSFSTLTSYENQTKKAINNKFIQEFLTNLLRERLRVWFIENQAEANRVLEQILANKRSRENAEKQRLTLKKKLSGNIDNINNRIKNFVDCRSRDVSRRELYIVEGNSALGSVKMARDAEFQAVIPLRGKILNCLKADLHQIFQSDIIMDLVRILGCGVELNTKQAKGVPSFDLKALRWDKIIICTDADVDGFQIRTLILAMLYRLTPTLIDQGKVYIAESPLFEIGIAAKGLELTEFAYSEKEKAAIIERYPKAKLHIQRSKGLGENEPEMMWQTTMNPASRRLKQILPEDPQIMQETFDLLLGDNLSGRKQYIEDFGGDYMDMLDVI